MANDTTTVLNPGTGGDTMDETLVTQTSGTQAKRARVAVGGDDGSLQTFESDANRTAAVVTDHTVIDLLEQLVLESKRHTGLLLLLLSNYSHDLINLEDLDELAED